jgi:hypothetical protein
MKKGFIQIITCDESWFYFEYLHQSVWAQSRNDIPERIKQRINTEKCLVSIIWSVNGIHSLFDLPKETIYNSTFFYDIALPNFIRNLCTHSQRSTLKGILMHLDNAHPTIQRNLMNVSKNLVHVKFHIQPIAKT